MNDPSPRARRAALDGAVLATTILVFGSTTLAAADLRIEVDLSTRMLTAYAGADVVQTYSGSVGTRQDPTPTGSFRMTPDEVTELAKLVMEHGGKPMPEPWYRRVFRRKSTSVVLLSNPIPMRVTT